jgi:hypothetical protein
MRSASGETHVVRALIEQHPTMVSLSVCIPMTWNYYDRCLRAYTLPDLMAYQNTLPGSNILCGTSNTQPSRTIELEHHYGLHHGLPQPLLDPIPMANNTYQPTVFPLMLKHSYISTIRCITALPLHPVPKASLNPQARKLTSSTIVGVIISLPVKEAQVTLFTAISASPDSIADSSSLEPDGNGAAYQFTSGATAAEVRCCL